MVLCVFFSIPHCVCIIAPLVESVGRRPEPLSYPYPPSAGGCPSLVGKPLPRIYSFQTFAVCPQDGRIHKRLVPSHPAHQDDDIAREVRSSFYSVYPVTQVARYQIEGPLNLRSVYSYSSRVGTSFGPIGLVRVALSFRPVFGGRDGKFSFLLDLSRL